MVDACVLTVVRDGDDYLEAVIDAVAPHVSSVRITVDSRSADNTREVVARLCKRHKNITSKEFEIRNPLADLVNMRNDQMGFSEPWGFIVDSDELHYDMPRYELGTRSVYALRCDAPWNEKQAHGASGKAIIGRFFRNSGNPEWRGRWGREVLYRNNQPAFSKSTPLLAYKYLHFTHLKKDNWRKELNQKRVADDRKLYDLPIELTNIIKKIHEKRGL